MPPSGDTIPSDETRTAKSEVSVAPVFYWTQAVHEKIEATIKTVWPTSNTGYVDMSEPKPEFVWDPRKQRWREIKTRSRAVHRDTRAVGRHSWRRAR